MLRLFEGRMQLGNSGIFDGFTDFHSHILPGVDDGVKIFDEAIEILGLYESLGIASVWLTPHIMEDIPNGTDGLKKRFMELSARYTGKVSLHLASENMLDGLFGRRLADGDLLSLGQGHLLVETSYFNPPVDLYGLLERIKARGYYPVLAHPERYDYMSREDYFRLKDSGVLFQLNLPSFTGLYGEHVRKKAEWLLARGFADMFGTDIHDIRIFRRLFEARIPMKIIEQIKAYKKNQR